MKWATEVVVSAYTGFALCEFSKIHEFFQYLTGGPVWTHQLPRVMDETKERIAAQHPKLADFSCDGINGGNWSEYAAKAREMFGDEMEIDPVAVPRRNPLTELDEMLASRKEHTDDRS